MLRGADNLEHVQKRSAQTARKYEEEGSLKAGVEIRTECVVASREKRKMGEVDTVMTALGKFSMPIAGRTKSDWLSSPQERCSFILGNM